MQVALIPPKGLENFALASRFHLALAIPELMERRAYSGMYKRALGVGDFVVLDNGAAEGKLASNNELWDMADRIGPSELVVPDVMGKADATIEVVQQFFKGDYVRKKELHYAMSYMAVVQGRSKADLYRCVDAFQKLPVNTIGIPRHLLTSIVVRSDNNKTAIRIDLANWIEANWSNRFQIHLLGTNTAWVGEVRAAAKYAPNIRSVDSSLPFNYALQGIELASTTKEKIDRDRQYFNSDWSKHVRVAVLRKNINTFMKWAGSAPTGVVVG